jgi:hypothetical protein
LDCRSREIRECSRGGDRVSMSLGTDTAQRNRFLKRQLTIICVGLCFLIAAHFLRFSNTISIRFNADSVTTFVHQGTNTVPTRFAAPTAAFAIFNRSMTSETVIDSIIIKRANGDSEPFFSGHSVRLFGFFVSGAPLRGGYNSFAPSFGDWTADRAKSDRVEFKLPKLDAGDELSITLMGRGDTAIYMMRGDAAPIEISLNDGFIDNANSLCVGSTCSSGYSTEAIRTNLLRIIGFLCEVAGAACLWALLLMPRVRAHEASTLSKTEGVAPQARKKLIFVGCFVLLTLHGGVCVYMSRSVLASTPHISDSAVYYRQAVLLSHGKLTTDPVPVQPAAPFLSNSSRVIDGRIGWFHANNFWPALLGLAIRMGIPDLLGPLLSVLSGLFIFLIGRALYSPVTGIVALFLYVISPFPTVLAGDYMMHLPAQAALLGAIVAAIRGGPSGKAGWLVLAGALFGFAFGMRQVSALAVVLPLALGVLLYCGPRRSARFSLPFATGLFPIFALWILDSRYITGVWWVTPHSALHGLRMSIENLQSGLNNVDSILGYLPPILFSSPAPIFWVGLAFATLVAQRDRRDWILALVFFVLLAVHVLLSVSGLHGYGPRFVFEAWFALMLLAARAIVGFGARESGLRRSVAGVALGVWFLFSLHRFLNVLPTYKDYNAVPTSVVEQLREVEDARAVFVMIGSYWQTLDVAATLLDPTFTSRIFIQAQPDQSEQRIIEQLSGWPVYSIEVNPKAVLKVEREAVD